MACFLLQRKCWQLQLSLDQNLFPSQPLSHGVGGHRPKHVEDGNYAHVPASPFRGWPRRKCIADDDKCNSLISSFIIKWSSCVLWYWIEMCKGVCTYHVASSSSSWIKLSASLPPKDRNIFQFICWMQKSSTSRSYCSFLPWWCSRVSPPYT